MNKQINKLINESLDVFVSTRTLTILRSRHTVKRKPHSIDSKYRMKTSSFVAQLLFHGPHPPVLRRQTFCNCCSMRPDMADFKSLARFQLALWVIQQWPCVCREAGNLLVLKINQYAWLQQVTPGWVLSDTDHEKRRTRCDLDISIYIRYGRLNI